MKATAGGAGWVVYEGQRRDVLAALFLRDALGLDGGLAVPRLKPTILVTGRRRPESERVSLERQWRQLWASVLDPEAWRSPVPLRLVEEFWFPLAVPVTGAEELELAIRERTGDAWTWLQNADADHRTREQRRVVRHDRVVPDAVRDWERRAGRAARAFKLNIETLPLDEDGLWWLGERTVAVDDATRSDPDHFAELIGPVIARIA